jgi:hypothetical protein
VKASKMQAIYTRTNSKMLEEVRHSVSTEIVGQVWTGVEYDILELLSLIRIPTVNHIVSMNG